MSASHNSWRALTLLLAGTALTLPLAGAQAQTPVDYTGPSETSLTAPTSGLFGGTWVATRDLNARERYFKLSSLSSGQVWGSAHLASVTEQTGSLQLRRTGPDRLNGSYFLSPTVVVNTEIIAPAGKPYRFMELTFEGGRKTGSYLRRVGGVGTPSGALTGAALRERMVGRWDTGLGALTIQDEGGRLVGRFRKMDGTTYLQPLVARFSPTTEMQRWAVGHDPSGNDVVLVLSPDASEFRIYDDRGLLNGARQITAVRVAEAQPVPAPAPSPAPSAQWQAFDGVWAFPLGNDSSRRMYLEFKVANGTYEGHLYQRLDDEWRRSSTIEVDPSSTGSLLTGTLVETGAAGERQPVSISIAPDRSYVTLVASIGTEGAKHVTFGQRTPSIGTAPVERTTAATAAAMIGNWSTPHGQLAIASGDEPTRLHGAFSKPGAATDGVRIIGQVNPGGSAQSWFIGPYNSGRNFHMRLSPDGKLLYAFAGGGPEDWVNAVPLWQATRAGVATSPAPAQVPVPAPVPAPTPAPPPVVVEAPPLPATVQAGTFHHLEAFDVRLDETRAARDGTVYLFFTVRNDSGRDQQIGAGTFTAVMSDADGVGVREAQIWRASGETPTQFDRPPVVPAGGEFKFRFVLTPPIVHAPLQRVSIRESDRKVLFFSVAGADQNPSRASAPAQGGGAFKSLSKLDVRIDRVGRARDGLLEAFLTLRNPGTAVETTSKGWIKLSGTDADGGKATSRSALYSVRGERGNYDELPLLIYVEPGQQVRLRYVFDQAISGPLTVGDGTVSQTFTAG